MDYLLPELNPGEDLLVDQFDLLTDATNTAPKLASFLGMNATQRDALVTYLATRSPQQTQASQGREVQSLEEMPWTDSMKKTFVRICGPAMREHGYSLHARYYAKPSKA